MSERLRVLAADLADRHWWQRQQASVFVLTDLPPVIPPVRYTLEMHGERMGAVRLDIAPGVPSKQVVRGFVISSPGMSWEARLVRWNADVEIGWRYASRRTISQAAARAGLSAHSHGPAFKH